MKKYILSIIITLGVVAAALTGCGTEKVSESVETEEAVQTQVRELKKLNVAYMPNYGSLWSIVNAIEAGYMEEEGIEVNLIEFKDGPTIIAALKSAAIDIGYIGQGAHKLCMQGEAKIFALSHISNADMVIGGPKVNSIEDLNGRRVAYVENTSSEEILVNSLKMAGMSLENIDAIDMDPDRLTSAIETGGVDAVAVWSPYSLEILKNVKGTKKLTDNMTFAEETLSLASWVVTPEFAEENKGILVDFTRALFRAMDDAANQNQKQTASLIAKQLSISEEEVYEQRGDAQWLTGKEVASGAESGIVRVYYELQKQSFLDSGVISEGLQVDDYVMFDIMTRAGAYY